MRTIGNILWVIFGGMEMAFGWFLAGCLWSITMIGLPVGMQCFKIAGFVLWPFKKQIVSGSMGAISFFMNVIWVLVSGIWLALAQVITGITLCITIIGIPFGLQHFKYAALALMPFGTRVEKRYF